MSDSRLVQAFRDYEAELIQFLSARLRSSTLAQDLTQELYLKIRALDDGPVVRNSRAYLFRMASNLALDHLRGERRRAELLAEARSFLGEESDMVTPEQALIAREELARLRRAMEDLPPISRRIFRMSRFDGLSQREIADRVGLSPTAVFKHIRKVMDHLATVRDP